MLLNIKVFKVPFGEERTLRTSKVEVIPPFLKFSMTFDFKMMFNDPFHFSSWFLLAPPFFVFVSWSDLVGQRPLDDDLSIALQETSLFTLIKQAYSLGEPFP